MHYTVWHSSYKAKDKLSEDTSLEALASQLTHSLNQILIGSHPNHQVEQKQDLDWDRDRTILSILYLGTAVYPKPLS